MIPRENPISKFIVTPETQDLRIRLGCSCEGLAVDVDNVTGHRKIIEYNMCPDGDKTLSMLGCEIFRDQKAMGRPLEDLACVRMIEQLDEPFKDLTLEETEAEFESLEAILEARQRYEEAQEQDTWG